MMLNESIEFDIKVNGKQAKASINDVEKAQEDLSKSSDKTSKNIKTNWTAIGAAVAVALTAMGAMMKSALDLERATFGLSEQTKKYIEQASEQYAVSQTVIAGYVQMGKAAGLSGETIAKMIDQGVALGRSYPHEQTETMIDALKEFYATGEEAGFVTDVLRDHMSEAQLQTATFAEKMAVLESATKGVNEQFDKTNAAQMDKALQEMSNTASTLGDSLLDLAKESGAMWLVEKLMKGITVAAYDFAIMSKKLKIWSGIGDTEEAEASLVSLTEKVKKLRSELRGETSDDEPITLAPIDIIGGSRPSAVPTATKEADKEREIALRANERFWNEYNRATNDALTYEMGLLDEQYKEYDKYVKDKASLDEWYNAERIRLLEYYDEQMKAYAAMGDALTQGLTDGIISFTETGKLNFKDMTNSIIQDMLKIQIQSSMMQLFGSFGSDGGGLLGAMFSGMFAKGDAFSNGNITPFANGGVVSSPTLFPMASGMGLMGEAGAEAIVPLTRTSDGDLGVKATSPVVNVNVQNYGNDNVEVQQNGDNISVIISQIASSIQRGTGDIGSAIEGRYGLRKA